MFSFVQFSHLVLSDSFRPHGLQHTRLPYLSPTPGTCSNSCPSSQWYHPTISSSVVPLSSCLHSFAASGAFLRSQFFASHGQSIGTSASASVIPMNIQDWFPFRIDWFDLLAVQGTLKTSPAPQFESINSSAFSLLYGPALTSIQDYWKNQSFDYMNLYITWIDYWISNQMHS